VIYVYNLELHLGVLIQMRCVVCENSEMSYCGEEREKMADDHSGSVEEDVTGSSLCHQDTTASTTVVGQRSR